jgi:hypothetical protein
MLSKLDFTTNYLRIKKIINLLFTFSILLIACNKKDGKGTIPYVTNQLTDKSSKIWHLKALFINGQNQTLTNAQSIYTKTYKTDGTWLDSDGYKGIYTVVTVASLKETTTNNLTGNSSIQLDILSISSQGLTLEYSQNQIKYKLEFVP